MDFRKFVCDEVSRDNIIAVIGKEIANSNEI